MQPLGKPPGGHFSSTFHTAATVAPSAQCTALHPTKAFMSRRLTQFPPHATIPRIYRPRQRRKTSLPQHRIYCKVDGLAILFDVRLLLCAAAVLPASSTPYPISPLHNPPTTTQHV